MEFIFATNNKNKIKEIAARIEQTKANIKVKSLRDINFYEDIPENEPTLEGNASSKSHYIFHRYHVDCFADDTGLEVEALNGAPGVYSARYAGEPKNMKRNIKKLLNEMKKKNNRKARFRTVISLIINGEEKLFEGIVNGKLLSEEKGSQGFGYDPLFVPDGYLQTFAQMPLNKKNKISHRAKALDKLVEYLAQIA